MHFVLVPSSPLYVEFKVGDQKELKVRVNPKGAPSEPQVDGIIVSVVRFRAPQHVFLCASEGGRPLLMVR